MITKLCTITLILTLNAFAVQNYDSAYTSIEPSKCHTLSSDDIGSTQLCQSYKNFTLKVLEGDLRQSITLEREGKVYPLDFWTTVTSNWSSLGSKIEWRYPRGKANNPIALITRLKVSENPENPEKMTAYLVVSKITKDEICVVGKISPQSKQNELAREMAEIAITMACVSR